jgi:hypothetical protein
MSNDVALFDKANLPAHLAQMFPATNDLSANVNIGSFAHLSIKGKVWTVIRGKDDKQVVMNEDGDPRSSIEVVIIKANPHISKVFYMGGYVEGSDAKPACYSNDGIAPAADAAEPQSKKCAICPHNQWGSKITENGSKIKACTDSRRLAVAPAGDLKDPMLLRVPAASLKPLGEYGEMFARKGVPYQAAVTKIRFDPEAASPRLLFKFERFLDADDAATVREMIESSVVANIVGDGPVSVPDVEATPAVAKTTKPVAKAAAPVEDDAADEAEEEAPVTKKGTTVPKEGTSKKSAFGGSSDEPAAAKEKPAPKAAAKAKVVEDDDDLAAALDGVLGALDDE